MAKDSVVVCTPSPRALQSVSPSSEDKHTPPNKREVLKMLMEQRDRLEALLKLKKQRTEQAMMSDHVSRNLHAL